MNDREEGFVPLDAEEEEVEGMESFPAATVVGGKGFVGRTGTEGDGGGGGAGSRTGGSTPFSVLSAVPSVVNWHKSRRELQQQERYQYQQGGDQGRQAGEGRSERAAAGEYDVIRQSLVRRIRSAIERRGAPTSLSSGGNGDRRYGAGADSGLATSPSTGQDASEEYFVVL
jgi:hypothetical protein